MKMVRFYKQTTGLGYIFILLSLMTLNSSQTRTAWAAELYDINYGSKDNVKTLIAPLNCVAFSPYVNGYDPNQPNVPAKIPPTSVIDDLLDVIVQQANYNCIMTYGVNAPLDHIFPAAQTRGLKVFANIWLEPGAVNTAKNATSIQNGITVAKAYPDTIIRLSCGVEVRNRAINNGLPLSAAEAVITDCINQLRAAGVAQPITTIDTWWNWCNAQWPCQSWSMASNVDWIGINVYPWWENKYSGLFTCTTAVDAPQFHIDRITNVQGIYPGKEVVLTEFGWPAGPDGYTETNVHTSQKCGIASEANQDYVTSETLKKLNAAGIQGVVFEAFREPWKIVEGPVGSFWGTIVSTFSDVTFSHPYFSDIEILYANGYTGGCSTTPLNFCPDVSMSRAQAAVFMLRGNYGSGYTPPSVQHIFADNWANSSWGEGWAEGMYKVGLTAGCLPSPLKFCPDEILTNVQVAVFGLRLKYGNAYAPPAGTGTVFADMTDTGFWGLGWAEQAYADGLLPACGTTGGKPKFCPDALVSRGFGASVIVKAKNLTMP